MALTVKKKILVLASTFPRWKNDTTPPFIYELEKRLGRNFEICVLVPHSFNAKKYEQMESITVHRFQYFWPAKYQKLCYQGGILPNIKKNKLLFFQGILLIFFEFLAAVRLVKTKKIHAIHAHWVIPQGIVAILITSVFGIPYLLTTHGGDIYGLQNPFFQLIKKRIIKKAKKITVVSSAISKEIRNKIDSQVEIDIISMGVDANLFHPSKYSQDIKKKYLINGPLLLFVGRLVEKKGIIYLLHAFPKILKSFPEVKLLVVGEGVLQKELVSLVKNLNIEKNVIFIGPLANDKLPYFYATADIFVGPSIKESSGDTEGLGLTFVEASFSECVPIGTNVGGITDVIKDGQTGYIVSEKNSEQIAEVVIDILKHPERMKKIKKQTRLFAIDMFDWNIVANKYKELYLKL